MAFVCDDYTCDVLCQFDTGGKHWVDFHGIVDYCCNNTLSDCKNCVKYYLNQSPCELFNASDYIDTVYIGTSQCDSSDFYRDFNNAVNNTAMSVFLMSVMAGILAVRAVIKVIKGAVR